MARKTPFYAIDIKLPERVLLDGGTMFVVLPTLDALEAFWNEHQSQFAFAAEGRGYGERHEFLRECEWVFGPAKAAVVNTVCRWDQLGVKCEWYDWAGLEPEDHADWFRMRDEYRGQRIAEGKWTTAEEVEHRLDCISRSPSTYRGYWCLENLPGGMSQMDWFSPFNEEIIDPNLSLDEVARLFQEQTFDDWKATGDSEVEFYNAEGVRETIQYWRHEQRRGEDYYGRENEVPGPPVGEAH